MHSLSGQSTQLHRDWSKPCIHSLDKLHSHTQTGQNHAFTVWTINHTATHRLVKTMHSLSGQSTQLHTDWSKPCIHSLDNPHSYTQTGQNHVFTLWTNHTATHRLVKTMHSLSGQSTQQHTDWSKPCIHSLDKLHSHTQTGQNHAFTVWTINHTATHRLVKTMHSLSGQSTQPHTDWSKPCIHSLDNPHSYTQTGQNHAFTLWTIHTATHRLVKTMHSLSGQSTQQHTDWSKPCIHSLKNHTDWSKLCIHSLEKPHRLVKTMYSLSGQTKQPDTEWSKPCTLWTNHTDTRRLVKTMHSLSGQLNTQTHADWSKSCFHSLDKPHSHSGQNHAFTVWIINHTATYMQTCQNYETDACPQVYLQQNKVHEGWRYHDEHCHP